MQLFCFYLVFIENKIVFHIEKKNNQTGKGRNIPMWRDKIHMNKLLVFLWRKNLSKIDAFHSRKTFEAKRTCVGQTFAIISRGCPRKNSIYSPVAGEALGCGWLHGSDRHVALINGYWNINEKNIYSYSHFQSHHRSYKTASDNDSLKY